MKINAETIKALRKKLRRTQAEFAHIIGVDPITICRWEKGHCLPSGLNLRRGLTHLMELHLSEKETEQ